MTQLPCESSLRPDYLVCSFRSASENHRRQVWNLVQGHVAGVAQGLEWETAGASRHFEDCFRHAIGARFETSHIDAVRNAGVSVVTFSGRYFALSSVYQQMALIRDLTEFKGRYHFTRLDCQVTTLNPSQSAEQIVHDIRKGTLWIKGYRGWEARGLEDLNGQATGGLSACFGAPSSDRNATSYNKAAEQGWDTPARRDEVRLRGDWAELHTDRIATAISGAASEDAAIEAFQNNTAAVIQQHMQYLDLTGAPIPRPKDWARGRKRPKWWSETLDQQFEPVRLPRKAPNECWEKFNHKCNQYLRTDLECLVDLVVTGRSESIEQGLFDLAKLELSKASPADLQAACERLPEELRTEFLEVLNEAADAAAEHMEFV